MTLTMYDSTNALALPAGGDAYLGYADGNFENLAQVSQLFPQSQILSIAVFASGTAQACDCESQDLTTAQVPPWVQAALGRGVHRPVVYASAALMPGLVAGLAAAGIARSQVRLWSAHYLAGEHICGPDTCAVRDAEGRVVPACDGTQWAANQESPNGRGKIDISALNDDFFAPPPPVPAPAPPRTGRIDMILIQVDQAQVPAGTAWPGVFLLGDGGLRHVTSPPDVAAYQKAGIPGPVTITWSEYLARVG